MELTRYLAFLNDLSRVVNKSKRPSYRVEESLRKRFNNDDGYGTSITRCHRTLDTVEKAKPLVPKQKQTKAPCNASSPKKSAPKSVTKSETPEHFYTTNSIKSVQLPVPNSSPADNAPINLKNFDDEIDKIIERITSIGRAPEKTKTPKKTETPKTPKQSTKTTSFAPKTFIKKLFITPDLEELENGRQVVTCTAMMAVKEILFSLYILGNGKNIVPEIYNFEYKHFPDQKRIVIKVYMEDLGKKTIFMDCFSSNANLSFSGWHKTNAGKIVKLFSGLNELGVVHGDAWSPNVIDQGDKFVIFDLETATLEKAVPKLLVHKVFHNTCLRENDYMMTMTYDTAPRPLTDTKQNFDAIFFVYTNAHFWCHSPEHEKWWNDATRFVLKSPEFKPLVKNHHKFIDKFTETTDAGQIMRSEFRSPIVFCNQIVL